GPARALAGVIERNAIAARRDQPERVAVERLGAEARALDHHQVAGALGRGRALDRDRRQRGRRLERAAALLARAAGDRQVGRRALVEADEQRRLVARRAPADLMHARADGPLVLRLLQ